MSKRILLLGLLLGFVVELCAQDVKVQITKQGLKNIISQSLDRVLGAGDKSIQLEKAELQFQTKPIEFLKDLPKKIFDRIQVPIKKEYGVDLTDNILKELGKKEYCYYMLHQPRERKEEQLKELNNIKSKLEILVTADQFHQFEKRLCDLVKSQKKNNGFLKVYGKNIAGVDLMAGTALDVNMKNMSAKVELNNIDIKFLPSKSKNNNEVPVEINLGFKKINILTKDILINEGLIQNQEQSQISYYQDKMQKAMEEVQRLEKIKQEDVSAKEWNDIQIDLDTYTVDFYRNYATKYCMEKGNRDGKLDFEANNFDIDLTNLAFKFKAIAVFDFKNEGLQFKNVQIQDNITGNNLSDKIHINFGSDQFNIQNIIFPTYHQEGKKTHITCNELQNSSVHLRKTIDEELAKLPTKLSPKLAELLEQKLYPKLKNKLEKLKVNIKSTFQFKLSKGVKKTEEEMMIEQMKEQLKQQEENESNTTLNSTNDLMNENIIIEDYSMPRDGILAHLEYSMDMQAKSSIELIEPKERVGAVLQKYLMGAMGKVSLDKVYVDKNQGLNIEADLDVIQNGKSVECIDQQNNCHSYGKNVTGTNNQKADLKLALNGKLLSSVINHLDQELFSFFVGKRLVDEDGNPILSLNNYDLGVTPAGENKLKIAVGINVNTKKMNNLMKFLFGNAIYTSLSWQKFKSKICQSTIGQALYLYRLFGSGCEVDQELAEHYSQMQLVVPVELEVELGKMNKGNLPIKLIFPDQDSLFESNLIEGNWKQYYLLDLVVNLLKGKNMILETLDSYVVSMPNLYEITLQKTLKDKIHFGADGRPYINIDAKLNNLNATLGIEILEMGINSSGHIGVDVRIEKTNKLWKKVPELREVKI
jgi:hypothetical protein